MRRRYLMAAAVFSAVNFACASAQNGDPPGRVARLSDMSGNISLYPVGATDWSAASINYPLTSGDAVWADNAARGEVQLGPATLRLGAETSIVFGELSDSVTQVRIDQGSIIVTIDDMSAGDYYEIDTPTGAVSLVQPGTYRVDVTPDGQRATITVRDGAADAIEGDRHYSLAAGTSAILIAEDRAPAMTTAVAVDEWERWASSRERAIAASPSAQYVSTDMVGYEDLDTYGTWQNDPDYGSVWIPRDVPADWAPYRYGRWEWVQPWGWTWIDQEPWGFAPFHYGRWTHARGRWAWTPGPRRSRPVFAPALVAFVGGSSWGASLSVGGGGGGIGWIPLAPGEPYIPDYRASDDYRRRINVNTNPRFDPRQASVDRVQYANRNIPGAVTAVPRDAFVRSRPVAPAAITVRPSDLANARASTSPDGGAGNVRLAPIHEDRGQRAAQPPRGAPPAPAAPIANPDRARGRGRQAPAGAQPQPPAGPPPAASAPPRPDQGRGRGAPPEPTPPPAPPRPSGPPAGTPPPAALPVQPPPASPPQHDRGRGRGLPLQPPPTATPPRPSGPPAGTPPPAPLPVQPPSAPADRGRSRSRPEPPPAAPRPATPPAQTPPPLGRGHDRPPPPPPQHPPATRGKQPPPPPAGRGRGHAADTTKAHKPPPPPPKPKP